MTDILAKVRDLEKSQRCLLGDDSHNRELLNVLAEAGDTIEALRSAFKGRPMETAPKGWDIHILVYGKWDGEIHGEVFPNDDTTETWCVAHWTRKWTASVTDGYAVWCDEPKAWLPLPEPPNAG